MTNNRAGTDNLWEAMSTQRAIRHWEQRPVPDDLLRKVVEAATRAPSGTNLQPWRFIIIRNDATRGAIAALLRERFEANAGLKQYVSAGLQSANKTERLMMKGVQSIFTNLATAPVFIVPCLYRVASPTTDATTLAAGSSIYQAVQNMLLAARGLGLGTVMTTFNFGIEKELRDMLGLPEDAKPAALIPLGYPSVNFGPVNRKPVEEVTYWERWEGAP